MTTKFDRMTNGEKFHHVYHDILYPGFTYRSDGTLKQYSINKDGKLLTVVLTRNDAEERWDITEVKVHN